MSRVTRQQQASVAPLPAPRHLDLATLLIRGLVALDRDDLAEGNLSLELGLTLWMSRSGAGVHQVRSTLRALRSALLRASDLDEASEPVPLMAGDDRTAVLNLAIYLHGLLQRSARSRGSSPAQIAEGALAVLPD